MRQVWCEIRLHDTFVTWTGKRCSIMDILHHFTTSHYVIMHQIKTTYCIHRSLCILLFFPLAPFWPIIEERPSFASWRSCEVSLWSIVKQKSKWRAQVKSSLALKPEWTVSFLCCPSKAVWENCEDVWRLQGTQEKSLFCVLQFVLNTLWASAEAQYEAEPITGPLRWTPGRFRCWFVSICFRSNWRCLSLVWLAQKCCISMRLG